MVIPYYVYIYFDPRTDEPFYVGKGKGNRGLEHLSMSRTRSNKAVVGRIRQLKELDLEPVIRHETFKNEKQAFMAEKLYIYVFGRKDLGTGCLFNLTYGGEGASGRKYSPSPETIEKARAISKELWKLPEYRQKQVVAHKDKHPSPETLEKMSLAQKRIGNRPPVGTSQSNKKGAVTRRNSGVPFFTKPHSWLGKERHDMKGNGWAALPWITDGQVSKKLKTGETLPDGWRYGRCRRA
jgi:hypothetical protein